jgi:signal transduction histidine kinase
MPKRFQSTPLLVVLLALIYFGAGRLGLSFAQINRSTSAVWPPTGIALAAFLLFGDRIWPGILAGAFLVNITTSGSLPASALIAIGNTLEGWAGAYLVIRFARGRQAFDRAADIFRFMLLGGLVGPMVSATIGATSLMLTGLGNWPNYLPIWITWWLGDATGAMIVGPFLILWAHLPKLDTRRPRVLEAIGLVACTIAISVAAFGGLTPINARNYPLEYIILPLVVWAAFRFAQTGSAGVTLLLSSIAIWGTLHGFGPFARETENTSLLLLQSFMGIVSITGLALASVVARRAALAVENARLFAEAQQVNALLEQRIHERTGQLVASNARLQAEAVERHEAQGQLEEFQARLRQLSAHVQAAREEERANAAREIHDELGQELTVLKMAVARLSRAVDHQPPEKLRQDLQALSGELDVSIGTVRRIAANLRPAILDDFGLLAAIEWQLQEFQKRTGVASRFTSNVESLDLPPENATALFRLCQEALTNVARHAHATEVEIAIEKHPDGLVVRIADNGRGIAADELTGRSSLGLLGMRERVNLLRGTLDISGAPGRGTTVRVSLPLN